MKIFVLLAAIIVYLSVAMQNTVQVINYPHPGIQLPEVKVQVSKKALATEITNPNTIKVVALI